MQLPITIGLHRSSFQRGFLIVTALLASVVVLFFPRSVAVQAALLLMVWGVTLFSWRRLASPLSAIRLETSGQVQAAITDSHEFRAATILPGATVHPWLTVLRLEFAAGERCTLLLTPGAMPADDFRRLRVFLRWRAELSDPGGGL